MLSTRICLSAAVVSVALATAASRSSVLVPLDRATVPDSEGTVLVAADRLKAVFPRVPVGQLGNGFIDTVRYPAQRVVRRYCWIVSRNFPDSRYPNNHFMLVDAEIALDPAVEPTRERLDSAFRHTAITVSEAAGEPPMTVRSSQPSRAAARFEAGRVVLELEGRQVIAAFLEPGGTAVGMSWCERRRYPASVHLFFRRP